MIRRESKAVGIFDARLGGLTVAEEATNLQACRRCQADRGERIKRTWWMRLFPNSRHYLCGGCYKKYWRV